MKYHRTVNQTNPETINMFGIFPQKSLKKKKTPKVQNNIL